MDGSPYEEPVVEAPVAEEVDVASPDEPIPGPGYQQVAPQAPAPPPQPQPQFLGYDQHGQPVYGFPPPRSPWVRYGMAVGAGIALAFMFQAAGRASR